jgi:hypothetical protein
MKNDIVYKIYRRVIQIGNVTYFSQIYYVNIIYSYTFYLSPI